MRESSTYSVVLSLEPIERLLCAECTVSWDSVDFILVGVCTASSGYLGSSEGSSGDGVCDVAFEAVHVVLFASAIGLQNRIYMSIEEREEEVKMNTE